MGLVESLAVPHIQVRFQLSLAAELAVQIAVFALHGRQLGLHIKLRRGIKDNKIKILETILDNKNILNIDFLKSEIISKII